MATWQQIDDQVARLVSDASGTLVTSSTRTYHTQNAYTLLQARIREVDPAEFIKLGKADIVANQANYARPTYEHVRRYEWLLDDGVTYAEIGPLIAEQAIPLQGRIGTPIFLGVKWYIQGQELFIYPTPTKSVTGGLGVAYVEVQLTGPSSGTPRTPQALHELIAYGAAIRALEETKDAAQDVVDTYRRRWEAIVGTAEVSTPQSRRALATYYRQAQPYQIGVGLP